MNKDETTATPAQDAFVEDAPSAEANGASSDQHEESMKQQTETVTELTEDVAEETQTASPSRDTNTTSTAPPNVTAQLEEYLALAQRTRAEFANYKKRVERELSESKQRGALDAIAKVLPVIDDFERAMQNVPAELQEHSWVSGVGLMLRKFEKLLNEFEVEVIDPVGQVFDPSRHEALGMDESDTVESGHVTVTLQKGYASGDRVLRPALVRVAN